MEERTSSQLLKMFFEVIEKSDWINPDLRPLCQAMMAKLADAELKNDLSQIEEILSAFQPLVKRYEVTDDDKLKFWRVVEHRLAQEKTLAQAGVECLSFLNDEEK